MQMLRRAAILWLSRDAARKALVQMQAIVFRLDLGCATLRVARITTRSVVQLIILLSSCGLDEAGSQKMAKRTRWSPNDQLHFRCPQVRNYLAQAEAVIL